MKVWAYFITYNDEHILPHLLRYYSSFCERIVLYDNGSTDRTKEIARSFSCVVVRDFGDGSFNDLENMKVKNSCWKEAKGNGVDFVIVADSDEFIVSVDEYGDFGPPITAFQRERFIPGHDILLPMGHQMIGDEDLILREDDNILELIKESIPSYAMSKPIIFKPDSVLETSFSVGCHKLINPIGYGVLSPCADILLCHYKYRGIQEFVERHLSRGKRLSGVNKALGLGSHYLMTEEQHREEYKTFVKKRTPIVYQPYISPQVTFPLNPPKKGGNKS